VDGWVYGACCDTAIQHLDSQLGSLMAEEAIEDPVLAKLKARSTMLEKALQVRIASERKRICVHHPPES
jgi:hypothetical protein